MATTNTTPAAVILTKTTAMADVSVADLGKFATADIPHLSKAIFDLKCSPLKFTKGFDYKNLQQLQLGSSRLNSRNG